MMRGLSFFALLAGAAIMVAVPTVNASPTLAIAGPYGNEDGCAHEAGQIVSGDGLFVLRADGLEAYAGACEFVQLSPSRSGAAVATALCQSEGLYDIRMFTIVPQSESETLQVYFDNGELWHEVAPCP
jgi:hypothetical protein